MIAAKSLDCPRTEASERSAVRTPEPSGSGRESGGFAPENAAEGGDEAGDAAAGDAEAGDAEAGADDVAAGDGMDPGDGEAAGADLLTRRGDLDFPADEPSSTCAGDYQRSTTLTGASGGVARLAPVSTPGPMTVAAALQRSLATDPGRPFVTFYDDATAERTELSAATFANWVAKTANLLQDDLEVEPGGRVALLLPLHWQTAVWLAATWVLGAVVTREAGPEHTDVLVASPDRLAEAAAAGIPRVVGVSLRPLGGRLQDPPPGVVDYAAEVLGHGDRFVPAAPAEPDAAAMELSGRTVSQRHLLADADSAAAALPEATGMRLLTAASPDTYEGIRALLPLPLVTTGSVVVCRNLDPDALVGRVATERVTATVGVTADVGIPRLG